MNVYDLHHDIHTLLSSIIDSEGELTPELSALIDRLHEAIPDRVDTLYKVIRTATTCSTALRNEAQYGLNKARRWDNVKESMKEHLFTLLKTLNVKSLQTDLCRPTICKGPPVVEVEEGFNARDLEGGEWDWLLEKVVSLSTHRVKEQAKRHPDLLPSGIKVVPGKDYLRIV